MIADNNSAASVFLAADARRFCELVLIPFMVTPTFRPYPPRSRRSSPKEPGMHFT